MNLLQFFRIQSDFSVKENKTVNLILEYPVKSYNLYELLGNSKEISNELNLCSD